MKKVIIVIASIALIMAGAALSTLYILDMKEAAELYNGTDEKYTDYKKDGKVIISIDDDAGEEMVESTLSTTNDNDEEKAEEKEEESIVYSFRYNGAWEEQIEVDLKTIESAYPDVRGWLFFENEDISYPIVQGTSDDKYLRMAYNGETTSAGSIFMESLNMPDFSDSHIIIYGHNMRNRTMFGALRNYLNQNKYYDYHKYFQVIRLDSEGRTIKSRYKVFAYGRAKSYSKVYTVCRAHDSNFSDVIQYIQSNMTMPSETDVYNTDSVITLSTCSIGETRIVVNAVKVDEVVIE